MNKIKEVIDLVEHHPVRGVLARDNDNNAVEPCDPGATCFCLIGAIAKVYNIEPTKDGDKLERIEDVYDKLDKHPLINALNIKLGGTHSGECPSLHVAGVFDNDASIAIKALQELENEYEDQ